MNNEPTMVWVETHQGGVHQVETPEDPDSVASLIRKLTADGLKITGIGVGTDREKPVYNDPDSIAALIASKLQQWNDTESSVYTGADTYGQLNQMHF